MANLARALSSARSFQQFDDPGDLMTTRARTTPFSASTTVARPTTRTHGQRPPSQAPPRVDTWDVEPETTFLIWLADPEAPEELLLDDLHGVGLPASWLLGMLCASRTPLPAWAAERLGYRQPRSIGDAATDLLLAVSDPAGPRCPTFVAAKRYLRELDPRSHAVDDA